MSEIAVEGGTVLAPEEMRESSSVWRRLRANRAAMVAAVVLILILAAAIFASLLAPYSPDKQQLLNSLASPSKAHWLGTDDKGRDTYSRLLFAGRVAFEVSFLSVGIAVLVGVPIGLFVGLRGGWWDRIVMRVVDAIMTIPPLVSILALVGVLGVGIRNTAIALGVVFSTGFLRLTRGEVLAVREEAFVDAARVTGLSNRRIMWRHILPVAAPPLIVQATLMLGAAMLAEAGLSFLGVGVQVPDASWGSMLASAQAVATINTFVAIPPGLAILVSVLCLNLVGDGIRDAMARDAPAGLFSRRRRLRVAGLLSAIPANQPRVGVGDQVASPPALLEVSGLSIGFVVNSRMLPAVSDISFAVAAGETVALVGESGCGKTITALTIPGLLPPPGTITSGTITFGSNDLLDLDATEMSKVRGRDIGMVFQEPGACLNPAFTVGDQIAAPLRTHLGLSKRAARARAIELMERVGIPNPERRIGQFPHEFSGGMAQRVMIAIALACEPKLLIADEPTTALDVTVQNQVLDLIASLRDELGMGVVFVTHDLAVVADLADRAVVLYAGQVVESGPVAAIFSDPKHPYTRALMRSVPRNEPRSTDLVGIAGSVPQLGAWPVGCRFAPRCELATDECRALPIQMDRDGDHEFRCIHVRDRLPEAVGSQA